MDRLFVYGTLRPGSGNRFADELAKRANHIGQGTIKGRLYRVAHYPGLVTAQAEGERVRGDVFDGITPELWRMLDDYEGSDYAREVVAVRMEEGAIVEACVYRFLLRTEGLSWIRSGDWQQPPDLT